MAKVIEKIPGRPRLKRPPPLRKGRLRRRTILTGVPPHPEDRYFKSGLFRHLGAILTPFVFTVFHQTRKIDLFTRIARHKLPETLIFASIYERFTSVGPNRANRPLTDRESRLRSSHSVWVPTDHRFDRGGYIANTNDRLTSDELRRIFFRREWFGKYFENVLAQKKMKSRCRKYFSRTGKNNFFGYSHISATNFSL